jgi:hypothetical protein
MIRDARGGFRGQAPISLKLSTHLADQPRQPEDDPQLTVLGRLSCFKVDRSEVGDPAVDDHRFGMHVGQRTWRWVLVDSDADVDAFAAQERDIPAMLGAPIGFNGVIRRTRTPRWTAAINWPSR